MVDQMLFVVGGLGAVAGTLGAVRARGRRTVRRRLAVSGVAGAGRRGRRVLAGSGTAGARRAARLEPAPRPAAGVLSTGWPAAGCAACPASRAAAGCAWACSAAGGCAGDAWTDRGAVRACTSSTGTPLSAIRAAKTVAARCHDRLRKVSQSLSEEDAMW